MATRSGGAVVRKRRSVSILFAGLIVGLVSLGAAAFNCVDTFSTDPIGGGTVYSFTTDDCTGASGLTYADTGAGGGCSFLYNDTDDNINVGSEDALAGTTESFTIASYDGKAFVFNSIWYEIGPLSYASSVTIQGIGPEPFTISTSGPGVPGTYLPSGGSRLVTEVKISSVDFYDDLFDNVDVDLGDAGAAVYGNGQLIVNGDSTPSSSDDTNMGTTPIGTPIDKTFTISSIGGAALDLTGSPYVQFSSDPSGDFSIQAQPTTDPISSGGSDTFTVRFNPSSEGVKQATVSIDNDSEADPYTFTVQGEGSGAPEIDVQRPASTSIADGGTDAQGSKSIGTQVTLTYTVENTGDAQLSVTDIASASPSNVTVDDISPTSFTVASGGGTETFDVKYTPTALGAFSFELDIVSNDSDESNYDITVSGTGIDTDPPDVSDITLADADPTNASFVDFTVTFDESVTGVDTTDFVVDASGVTGASIDAVAGGGTTWTVSVDTGTGDGTLSIDLTDDDSIEDGSGNKLGGTGAGNGDFTAGAEYTIDKTPPSVPDGLLPADGTYVNTGTPTLSWNASTDTGGSGLRTTNTYRYQVSGPSPKDDYTANTNYTPTLLDGVYTWRIYARDNAGNNSDWSEQNTLTVDTDKPDVAVDQAGGQADPTNASPVTFTAVFDEPIDDATLTDADVSVGGTATTDAVTVTEIAPNDGTTFEVSIVVTGDGTVQPTIPAGGVEDLAGNTNNASTSTDNSVTFETDPPGVTSFARQTPLGECTNADVLVFRVTFDEDVVNVDAADFDVTGTTAPITNVNPVSASVYDITVTGGDLAGVNGTVGLDLAGDQDIVDTAGNALPAGEPTTDETYTVDNDPPGVTSFAREDPLGECTNADALVFRVTFDEEVINVNNADFDVTGTTAAMDITALLPSLYEITVMGGDLAGLNGTVGLDLAGGQDIEDVAGNALPAGEPGTDETYTVDNDAPSLTSFVRQTPATSPTNADVLVFRVTFDEDVVNVDAVDFDVTGTTAPITNVNPVSASVYDMTVMGGDLAGLNGTVGLDLAGGQDIEDVAGNALPAGEPGTDETYTVDNDPPGVASVTESPSVIADVDVGDQTFTLTIGYDEPMDTGVAPTVLFPTALEDPSSTIALDPASDWTNDTTYVARYDVVDANEEIDDVDVRVTGVRDVAGNAQTQYDEADVFSIDTLNPWISSLTSTTANGYYNVGAAIDVTMTFSESVTLTGPFPQLAVDLDSGAVNVPLALPAGVASTNGTYTVGADENSCDLNVVGITVNGSMRDAAGNDLDASKTMTTMSTNNLADNKDITVDTTDPVIGAIGITAGDDRLDADCGKTVSYAVTITDNCCIDLDASPIAVTPSATNATVSDLTMTCNPDTGKATSVLVSGTFLMSATDACSSIPSVQVDVVDCAGNTGTRTDSGPTVSDSTEPTFSNFAVTPADGLVDASCAETVAFSVDVHDNCSVDLDDPTAIVVTESATNASTSGLAWSVDEAGLQSNFTITGTFMVEDLTDCPAVPTVEVRVTDLCGNEGTASQDGAGVADDIVPVIHDLMFYTDATYTVRGTDFYVDDCCSARLYFAAYVTDNCCIRSDHVTVALDVPVGGGVLVGGGADRIQNGPNRVDVTGYLDVGCLTSCPARAEVLVLAMDCCGNRAEPVRTTESEGLIWDTVEPIPRDDPRQDVVLDESAIIDSNDPTVEVRLDEFGVYRLILREDTPARIDVVANDGDNCSCEDCAHPFDPCGGCGVCPGCCATMTVHEIVAQPTHGTATIEGDEGDCNGGSVIRYAPDRGYVGPDEFTYRIRDACGNVSSGIATVYVQTVPKMTLEDVYVTACSGEAEPFTVSGADLWVDYDPTVIPFLFTIVDGPEHGIVTGDPTRVELTPPSTVDVGGGPVPTLDFTETAEIELVYTSAVGYTGRDAITVRFADPFGNETTGRVDVSVIECAGDVGLADVVVRQGEILPIIAPEGFGSVVETAWGSVLLIDLADGMEYSEALSAAFGEEIGRYVVYADTGLLPLGRHLLVMPLGNGETVELTIEVYAPDL